MPGPAVVDPAAVGVRLPGGPLVLKDRGAVPGVIGVPLRKDLLAVPQIPGALVGANLVRVLGLILA